MCTWWEWTVLPVRRRSRSFFLEYKKTFRGPTDPPDEIQRNEIFLIGGVQGFFEFRRIFRGEDTVGEGALEMGIALEQMRAGEERGGQYLEAVGAEGIEIAFELGEILSVEVAVLVAAGAIFHAFFHHDGDAAAFIGSVWREKAIALPGEFVDVLEDVAGAHSIDNADLAPWWKR